MSGPQQESLLVPKHLERRLDAGRGLRLDLDDLAARVPAIPPGRKGRVAIGYEGGTAEVGAAWLTTDGWEIGGAVQAAVKDGRRVRVIGALTW